MNRNICSVNLKHCLDVARIASEFGSSAIVNYYLTSCFDRATLETFHHIFETAIVIKCEKIVLKAISYVLQNPSTFKKMFSCYISRQNLFIKSLMDILDSIKKCGEGV